MHYPDFYTQVHPIKLYDPLSDFLGAFEKGEVEISYLDCVKLAGHSCPTVAGAYLMAQEGLKALYGEERPVRGSIKIEMKEDEKPAGALPKRPDPIDGSWTNTDGKVIKGEVSPSILVAIDHVKINRLSFQLP